MDSLTLFYLVIIRVDFCDASACSLQVCPWTCVLQFNVFLIFIIHSILRTFTWICWLSRLTLCHGGTPLTVRGLPTWSAGLCWDRYQKMGKNSPHTPDEYKKMTCYKVLLACPRSFYCCFFPPTGGGCKFAPRCRDVAVHQSVEWSADAWPTWRLQRCTNAARPAHLRCSGLFCFWNTGLQMISRSLSIFSLI